MKSNQVLNIRHNLLQGQYVGIAPADIQQVGVMGAWSTSPTHSSGTMVCQPCEKLSMTEARRQLSVRLYHAHVCWQTDATWSWVSSNKVRVISLMSVFKNTKVLFEQVLNMRLVELFRFLPLRPVGGVFQYDQFAVGYQSGALLRQGHQLSRVVTSP